MAVLPTSSLPRAIILSRLSNSDEVVQNKREIRALQPKTVSISDNVQVVEIEPIEPVRRTEGKLRKAIKYKREKKYEKAIGYYTEAIDILEHFFGEDPENKDIRLQLANIYGFRTLLHHKVSNQKNALTDSTARSRLLRVSL